MGLVGNMDIVDNMMLRSYKKGASAFLDRKDPKSLADRIIESLDVVTPNAATPVRRLSGGNVQKVLVGREISSNPKVLMVAYPVRGLDINSSYTIYNLLTKQKRAVLPLSLSARIWMFLLSFAIELWLLIQVK